VDYDVYVLYCPGDVLRFAPDIERHTFGVETGDPTQVARGARATAHLVAGF
jgi:hypothetical protein